MKKIFEFFAKRHILATLFTFMILFLGIYRVTNIKRDAQPRVDFGKMIVTTVYPGASPEDVELNVTNKIEDELKGLIGIKEIASVSRENVSSIEITIDPDAGETDKIKQEIRDAVSRVSDFPQEVTESPQVVDLKTTIFPIIEVGLTADIPYEDLREHARLFEKELSNLPGVSSVEKYGWLAREIQVEVSPQKLNKYQMPLVEVINSIKARNIRSTAGTFESYTDAKNIVTLSEFSNPEEVGDVIIRSTFDGLRIRVKDLAVINDGFEKPRVLSRMNGKRAISFLIYKDEDADIIRTVDQVRNYADKYKKNLPEEVEISYSYDYSQFIRTSFEVIRNNGLFGLIFVVILLTIFLSFRLSFWVALGIPVSLLGTVFLLPAFGLYLDSITLSAMIIVIGIIVDDAIIISENIASKRQEGLTPLNAAVEGVSEVFFPVLTTVLTTFLAFAPMLFLGGVIGKFVRTVPITISLALFISLTEATVALPAHLVKGWTTCKPKHEKRMKMDWFKPIREGYQKFMVKILKFRYVIVPVFIVVLIATMLYASKYMEFILFPTETAERFDIQIELPIGTSLNATGDKITDIENIVNDLPKNELASYVSRVGASDVNSVGDRENIAVIEVYLTPFQKRDREAASIVDSLREITRELKGYENISYSVRATGPPIGKPINIAIIGVDDSLRNSLSDSVYTYLTNIKGIKDLDRNDKNGKNQIQLEILYDKLAERGLLVSDIAQNLRIAYDGEVATTVRYGEEDVDFRVILKEEARNNIKWLNKLQIPNKQGRMIPLKDVAVFSEGTAPVDFRHFDGERATIITGDIDKNITSPREVAEMVSSHFNIKDDYPGIRINSGGEAESTSSGVADLAKTMILSVIAIYFLLVLLFNSWTQPLLVMIAIPFGIAGVILAFELHGEPLGFLAVLGLIGLGGVVVNDSLVLVDFINNLRKKSPTEDIKTIIAQGTANRLRAVIITTLTTVAGLLPLAYGIGGADPFNAPMALALGWGLVFATPLTLLLVPCLYHINTDLASLFKTDKVCEIQ